MTLALTYKVNSGTSIDLSHVYLSTITGLTTCANQGTVGTSMLSVPDKGGLLDTILGLRRAHAHEDASPVANRRLYSAWTTTRRYYRGKFLTGSDRMIDVSLVDMNNFLSTKIIRDVTVAGTPPVDYTGVRPAETDLERIAWLLASPFINLIDDYGLVSTTGAVAMDAHDYTDSYAQDVLRDCGLASKKNWFCYNDEIAADAERFGLFYDFPYSEAFTSTLRLSDHPGDADGTTTFEMYPDVEGEADPSQLISGVNVEYGTGQRLFRRDTDIGLTTAATYYDREVNAPAPWIKTSTTASAYADKNLRENETEDFVATVRTLLPKEYVGLIRAGHRISCKFDIFPAAYRTFTWWRIIEQTIALDLGSEDQPKPVDFYNMTLKMVPATPPPSSAYLLSFLAQRDITATGPSVYPQGYVGATPVTNWSKLGNGYVRSAGNYPIDVAYRSDFDAATEPLTNVWANAALDGTSRPTCFSMEIAGATGPVVLLDQLDAQFTTYSSDFAGPTVTIPEAGWLIGFFSADMRGTNYFYFVPPVGVTELYQAKSGANTGDGGTISPNSTLVYKPVTAGSTSITLGHTSAHGTDVHNNWACMMLFIPGTDLSVVQSQLAGSIGGSVEWTWSIAP